PREEDRALGAAGAGGRDPDHVTPSVDPQGLRGGTPEGAQVGHRPAAGEERVSGGILRRVGEADDRTPAIDGEGDTEGAAQRAQVRDRVAAEPPAILQVLQAQPPRGPPPGRGPAGPPSCLVAPKPGLEATNPRRCGEHRWLLLRESNGAIEILRPPYI